MNGFLILDKHTMTEIINEMQSVEKGACYCADKKILEEMFPTDYAKIDADERFSTLLIHTINV